MDIGHRVVLVGGREEKVVQVLTGPIGKFRLQGLPRAGMTQSAIVQLPLSREARRIENVPSAGLPRMGGVILDMLAPVTVAFFTGNAQHVIPGVAHGAAIDHDRERSAVTLQAARDDESPKVDLAVRIAGAAYPSLDAREIP